MIAEHAAPVSHQLTAVVHLDDVKVFQIVNDQQVRLSAGGNGPQVIETEVFGRVERRHLYGDDRVETLTDGAANDKIDVPFGQ